MQNFLTFMLCVVQASDMDVICITRRFNFNEITVKCEIFENPFVKGNIHLYYVNKN